MITGFSRDLYEKKLIKNWKGLLSYFMTITGIQCATSNHAVRQVWRMRHRLATPGVKRRLNVTSQM